MKIRVADYIAQYLENLGVKNAFMLSGGGMMHLQDALSCREKMKYVCNHHEQASGFAADAFARESESLAVVYATCGPGASNTITAIAGSYQDSVPVVYLAGQAKVADTIRGSGLEGLRQYGTFEIDVVTLVQSITKYAVFLDDPCKVRFHLEKAVHLALSGRPGPVFLEVPVDVSGSLIGPEELEGYTPPPIARVPLAAQDVAHVVSRLASAKRPLILAGHGIRCAKAAHAFREMISTLNVPVATSSLAADLLPYDHPLYVGHPGVKGDRAGNFSVQTADVVLILGNSLHVSTTGYELDKFAQKAYKIQVELDPMVLKREKVGVQEKIEADVSDFITAMQSQLSAQGATPAAPLIKLSGWHERCQTWKHKFKIAREPHKREPGGLNYYDVIEELSVVCDENTTIVADAGCAFYLTGQAFRSKEGQRVILPGSLAQMGYTLPATTGACKASPHRTIVGVTGDGSLLTNVHELGVMAYHKLNAKILVINNGGYSCIRNTQRNYFGSLFSGTDREDGVGFPDTAKLAEAFGLSYLSTRSASELNATLTQMLKVEGPVICEVFTIRDQEFVPTVSSVRLPDGRMQSKPLHDMYPFMSEEELAHEVGTD